MDPTWASAGAISSGQRCFSVHTGAELAKPQGASANAARGSAEFLHLPGLGHS